MNSPPLSLLRRGPMRRAVSLLAAFALMWAGFAYASHYHRVDNARGVDSHLQCLLCLHADRSAGAPDLPQFCAPRLVGGTPILALTATIRSQQQTRSYDARGPPRV